MSYRFFFRKTFSGKHSFNLSFPPHFLSVHQCQPLLLISVLLLLGLSTGSVLLFSLFSNFSFDC
ncbi:hypothetical protein Gotur_001872 [Gossypium turneri]